MCMMNKRKSQMDHTIEHIRHRNPSVDASRKLCRETL